MPTTFYIQNYQTRKDLEDHIVATVGNDIRSNKEAGHEIKGTEKQLKEFSLSDKTTIFGIKCVSTYGSTDKKMKDQLAEKGKTWKD